MAEAKRPQSPALIPSFFRIIFELQKADISPDSPIDLRRCSVASASAGTAPLARVSVRPLRAAVLFCIENSTVVYKHDRQPARVQPDEVAFRLLSVCSLDVSSTCSPVPSGLAGDTLYREIT